VWKLCTAHCEFSGTTANLHKTGGCVFSSLLIPRICWSVGGRSQVHKCDTHSPRIANCLIDLRGARIPGGFVRCAEGFGGDLLKYMRNNVAEEIGQVRGRRQLSLPMS
jgi:hypothetical protein